MTREGAQQDGLELTALDGANPLGFLAAVGVLVVLHAAGEAGARLRWRAGAKWTPIVDGVSAWEPEAFSATVAGALEGRTVSPEAEAEAGEAKRRHDEALKAVKEKRKEINARKLGRTERRAAEEAELAPLEEEAARARETWLHALRPAVPRPELSMGDVIRCTPEEYRQYAEAMLECSAGDRGAIDLLAAFGTDTSLKEKTELVQATPFQFITGGGQQYFLKTARLLMGNVSPERVHAALFEPWTYADRKLSMRWDPGEDRRYALMDRDPTASGNEPGTVWMANLLGYRALALFPCVPRPGRLRVVGWGHTDGESVLTWPLGRFGAGPETVRSLLALPEVAAERPDHAALRERGVSAVFRCRRIRVGTGGNSKLNFSPARAV